MEEKCEVFYKIFHVFSRVYFSLEHICKENELVDVRDSEYNIVFFMRKIITIYIKVYLVCGGDCESRKNKERKHECSVFNTLQSKNHQNFIKNFQTKGWSNIFDEFIPSNSQRLAKLGSYTNRLGNILNINKFLYNF